MQRRPLDEETKTAVGGVWIARKERDVTVLVRALSNPGTAMLAVNYLRELGAKETAPELLHLLDSDDPYDRTSAVRALNSFGYRPALPRIREIAESDPTLFTRAWAVEAIGEMGD